MAGRCVVVVVVDRRSATISQELPNGGMCDPKTSNLAAAYRPGNRIKKVSGQTALPEPSYLAYE